MAQTFALVARPSDALRAALVLGCALALILAGQPLPSGL